MDRFRTWISSDRTHLVIAGCVTLVIAFLIFHAGVVAGSHRAAHEAQWRFRVPGFSMRVPKDFIGNGHGAVGEIQSVNPSSFVLTTRDGSDRLVQLASTTLIRVASGGTTTGALAAGERVVVLGKPGANNAINADLIRILAPAQSPR